jgi:hypothetical protein
VKRRRAIVAVAFPVLCWVLGGLPGLVIGLAVLVAWLALGIPKGALWATAVALLAVVPIALWAQGLPSGMVVGPRFGVDHLIAHRLVLGALLVSLFCGLCELLVLEQPAWSLPRAIRRAVAPEGRGLHARRPLEIPGPVADGDQSADPS